MNHALKITEDGTMIVTLPENMTIDRVIVQFPDRYRKMFVRRSIQIAEKIKGKIT